MAYLGSRMIAEAVKPAPKRWLRALPGIAISVACLALIASRVDFPGLGRALADFEWRWMLPGVLGLAVGYALRIVRWTLLLRTGGAPLRVSQCVAPFLGSIALNNVLPARAGDIVRVLVFPAAMGVPRTTALASVIVERLADLLTLAACLGVGLLMMREIELPRWVGLTVIGAAAASAVAFAAIMFASGAIQAASVRGAASAKSSGRALLERVLSLASDFFAGAGAMSRNGVLVRVFALSAIVWIAEAALFAAVLRGLSMEATAMSALVAMAIATFATLVPSSPGYVGPFHLAAFVVASALGSSAEQATSFAVLSHLGLWLPTTLAGAAALLLTPSLFVRSFGEGP